MIETALMTIGNSFGLPAGLLVALCTVESGLKPNAINVNDGKTPSYGLCQVKLATARTIDPNASVKKLMHWRYNAEIAARYLSKHVSRYKTVAQALSRYNTGKPYKTSPYARKVIKQWALVKVKHYDGTTSELLQSTRPTALNKR